MTRSVGVSVGRRVLAGVIAVGVFGLVAVATIGAPVAAAVSPFDSPITVTFNAAGTVMRQWTVPDGVTAVQFTAVGATGGLVAGFGATAAGTLTVQPGAVFDVWLGLTGSWSNGPVGGLGGWGGRNGARSGGSGGSATVYGGVGGGGATEIDVHSGGSSVAIVAVAGGGGGSSYGPNQNALDCGQGGSGGCGADPSTGTGVTGASGLYNSGIAGGGGYGNEAGGGGGPGLGVGSTAGLAGSPKAAGAGGAGGSGGSDGGGGGGGGYGGGGGGGGSDDSTAGGGGGGSGRSTFLPTAVPGLSGTATFASSPFPGSGSITFTYQPAPFVGSRAVSFGPSGTIVQQWVVPTGVTSVQFEVVGASGDGGGFPAEKNGFGAVVIGTLSVTPGAVLDVWVGRAGSPPTGPLSPIGVGGWGGRNGTRSGGDGGGGGFAGNGGGGATEIDLHDGSPSPPIVAVAGGGGGGADYQFYSHGCGSHSTGGCGAEPETGKGVDGGSAVPHGQLNGSSFGSTTRGARGAAAGTRPAVRQGRGSARAWRAFQEVRRTPVSAALVGSVLHRCLACRVTAAAAAVGVAGTAAAAAAPTRSSWRLGEGRVGAFSWTCRCRVCQGRHRSRPRPGWATVR